MKTVNQRTNQINGQNDLTAFWIKLLSANPNEQKEQKLAGVDRT